MNPSSFASALAASRPKGPTGEQQSSLVPELSGQSTGLPGWSHFLPSQRELSELWRGRRRTETVEQMVTHAKIAAIRQVIRLPADRYIVELDAMDADPVAVDLLASDLDVPLKDGPDERRPGRRANRFSERRHRGRVLDALDYGHAVFEQAGYIDAAGYWRLTDLPPVPQWTIDDENSWEIDRHGRLLKVIQWGCNPKVEIPVDHLVTFTWQGRPGDPRGQSLLRPLSAPWVSHDRVMRVANMSMERTGMGVPVGKVAQGAPPAVKAKMEQLLAGLAAGHDTNLVLETDEDIQKAIMLMGVTGSTPDPVGLLRYYDEMMVGAALAMVLQVGQGDTGSFALSVTLDKLLAMFHDAVIDWYCDVMTEQLVEVWIDRNRGEDAPAPRLVWRRREDTPPVAAIAAPAAAPAVIDGTATEIPAPAQLPAPVAASRAPLAAEFNPDQRRDNDGRWTDSVGNVMRVAMPADRERLSVPPAWTDVMVAADGHDDQPLQVIGTDTKGRTQRVYSADHSERQAAAKFARIEALHGVIGAIDAELAADTSDDAAALALMRRTGMRPGSEQDTGADVPARGATNLRVSDVTLDGNRVHFKFTGKKGVLIDLEYDDPQLAALLRPRVAGKGPDDQVFAATNEAGVRARLKKIAPGYKVKDLRTYRAARVAADAVAAEEPPPTTAAERAAARNRVGDRVAAALGNTRTVALNSYIPPAVFSPWDNAMAA